MRAWLVLGMLLTAAGCGDDGGGRGTSAPRLWVAAAVGDSAAPTGRLLVSRDAGATWRTAFDARAPIEGIAFTGDGRGAAVGRGLAFATRDGGTHWQTSRADPNEALADVALTDDGSGVAVGAMPGPVEFARGPLVLATTDAGAHWTVDELPPTFAETGGLLAACVTAA